MMTRDQICDALVRLGHQSKYWGPDQSSYAAFAAGWPAANGPTPTEAELQAAWDSGAADRAVDAKNVANKPILAQIVAKEQQIIRSMTELRRAQEFGDVPADVVTAAKAKFKAIYDEREVLRGQLQK